MTARRPIVNVSGTLQELATTDVLAITDVVHGGRGRLTLESVVAVSTTDQSAKTNVYYTPYAGGLVPLYDGTRWAMFVFSELTLALATSGTGFQAANTNYDLFVVNDAGTLRLGTGPAWTSNVLRGTGAGTTELERKNGLWTNKVSMTLRWGSASGNTITVAANQGTYVGTMRASANGQCEDSLAKRFLWNTYHRVPRPVHVPETTDSWTYSTATWRQLNNSTANQVAMVRGLNEDAAKVVVVTYTNNSSATNRSVRAGIGLDDTTAFAVDSSPSLMGCYTGFTAVNHATYYGFPGLGYHYLAALEHGNSTGGDTQTWFGDAGTPLTLSAGIIGGVFA